MTAEVAYEVFRSLSERETQRFYGLIGHQIPKPKTDHIPSVDWYKKKLLKTIFK